MITKDQVAKLKQARKETSKIEGEIHKYFCEIVGVVFECFKLKIPYNIYFVGAEEGESGHINPDDDNIIYCWVMKNDPRGMNHSKIENSIIEKYGDEDLYYDYIEAMPTKFLFMSKNEIKNELTTKLGELEYNILKSNNLEKENIKAQKTAMKKAKAKLSKEELKLLGIDKN